MVKDNKSKQNLRIAIACDIHLDGKDTRANHMLELFNNLSELCETYLLVPKPKQIKVTSPNIRYVTWFDIPLLRLIIYQITLFYDLFVLCTKVKIDVIYARQETFNFSPLIISKLLNIPYVVEINGLLIEEKRLLGINKRLIALTRLSEKINYRHAVRIISVTQEIKNGIMQRYNIADEKLIVIGNGANIDLFKPLGQNDAIDELNLNQKSRYICFVGNLTTWQGVEYIIQAAPLIISEVPDAKFLIVGDGMLKNELINLANEIGVSNEFIFTGAVNHKDVPLYINASEVCLAPLTNSRNVGGSSALKIYEYAACGKPIISSNIANLEFIESQNLGILVEPENSIHLAKAVLKILKDENLKCEMELNARDYIVKNHSWEIVAKKVIQVCRKSIKLRG